MRALLASLITALVVAVGRLKARWFRWRKLPLVRDRLALGETPAPPARVTALLPVAGPIAADERSPDYVSIPDSKRLVVGRESPVFRVASTRILPPPPLELAVFRPDRWDITRKRRVRRAGFHALRPGETSARQAAAFDRPEPMGGVARPAVFGVDEALETTRPEREVPEIIVDSDLPRHRPATFPTARLEGPADLGTLRPDRFDLADDGTPAAEAVPVDRWRPLRLPRAKASFIANYVDPPKSERLARDWPETFGETIEAGVEGFFVPPAVGGTDAVHHWNIKDALSEQLDEVKEQFGLRRDLDRAEFEEEEFGKLVPETALDLQSIFEYTGLEFMDLQPEPVERLRMELENPRPDLAPAVEHHEDALRWLVRALAEFPRDESGAPPVPEVP